MKQKSHIVKILKNTGKKQGKKRGFWGFRCEKKGEKMKKEAKTCSDNTSCRLGKVGGQAVIEGVMMKAGERTVTSCRKEDKSIVVTDEKFVSVRKKHKFLNIPILRGIINFVEMMILSVKTLNASAGALGLEEEETKFEKWLKKHFGIGIVTFVMAVGVVLGIALSLFLFMFLPIFVADFVNTLSVRWFDTPLGAWQKVIEGVLKMSIFVLYLWLVSFMRDIKRTFMYHGAEHKTIACFEAGEELTPENAKKHTRFHPRCGTSFMFFMILIGIGVGLLVNEIAPGLTKWQYIGIRLLILPLVVGVGYEFIMYAGRHNNIFVRILSAPGLWVQRLTTKEPTLDMLEVAIVSTKCALRDEIPEFMEFYKNREWEKKPEGESSENGEGSAEAVEEGVETPVLNEDDAIVAFEVTADNPVAEVSAEDNAAENAEAETEKESNEAL